MADTTTQSEQAPLEQLPPDEPSGTGDDAAGGSNSVTDGDLSAVRSHASKLIKKAKKLTADKSPTPNKKRGSGGGSVSSGRDKKYYWDKISRPAEDPDSPHGRNSNDNARRVSIGSTFSDELKSGQSGFRKSLSKIASLRHILGDVDLNEDDTNMGTLYAGNLAPTDRDTSPPPPFKNWSSGRSSAGGDFVRRTSHNFRTSLSKVMGAGRFTDIDLEDGTTEKMLDNMDREDREGDALFTITRDGQVGFCGRRRFGLISCLGCLLVAVALIVLFTDSRAGVLHGKFPGGGVSPEPGRPLGDDDQVISGGDDYLPPVVVGDDDDDDFVPAKGGDDDDAIVVPPPPGADDHDDSIKVPPPPGADDDDDVIVVPPPPGADDDDAIVNPPPFGADDDDDAIMNPPPVGGTEDDDDAIVNLPPHTTVEDDDDFVFSPLPGTEPPIPPALDDDDDFVVPPLPGTEAPLPPIPSSSTTQQGSTGTSSTGTSSQGDWKIEDPEAKVWGYSSRKDLLTGAEVSGNRPHEATSFLVNKSGFFSNDVTFEFSKLDSIQFDRIYVYNAASNELAFEKSWFNEGMTEEYTSGTIFETTIDVSVLHELIKEEIRAHHPNNDLSFQ